MGEDLTQVRARFNGSLRIESRPERLSGEAGGSILREIIERVGLLPWLLARLKDPRKPELITHPFSELLVTTVLLIALGWRDRDDADALRNDPVMRLIVSERRGIAALLSPPKDPGQPPDRNPAVPDGLASQPTLSRLVATLSTASNRAVLHESLLEVAARRVRASREGHRLRYVSVDLDSLPIEVYGEQPGSEYNGHYHARIFHPLVCSVAETGDLLDAVLREGTAHTAEGGLEFLLPLLDRIEEKLCQVASVRIDAGFPSEKFLGGLEQRHRPTPYVARIKNNPVLDRMAAPLLHRPVGRPPQEPRTWFHEMTYQAESWSRPRRVVLVVLERPRGDQEQRRQEEMFLHHFWLITSWTQEQMSGEALLALYRERGTAEGHQGELKSVLDPALSSSPRPKSTYRGQPPKRQRPAKPVDSFANNETLLLLNLLAYNILHVARVLLETSTHEGWSLKRLRERLLRVPARVLLHGRRAVLVIGEAAAHLWHHLWRKLAGFEAIPSS